MSQPGELPGSHPEDNALQVNEHKNTTTEMIREKPTASRWISRFSIKKRRGILLTIWSILTIGLLAGLIAVGVRLSQSQHDSVASTPSSSPSPVPTSKIPTPLSETNFQPASIPPVPDSGLGAGVDVFGTYFSQISGTPQTKIVYEGGNGKLCVRTKADDFLKNVQCVEGVSLSIHTKTSVPVMFRPQISSVVIKFYLLFPSGEQ